MNNYLSDSWRENIRRINEHVFFCRQHIRTLKEDRERLPYLQQCAEQLDYRLKDYVRSLKMLHEAEQRLGKAPMEPYHG